jgi:hypothetical protein
MVSGPVEIFGDLESREGLNHVALRRSAQRRTAPLTIISGRDEGRQARDCSLRGHNGGHNYWR